MVADDLLLGKIFVLLKPVIKWLMTLVLMCAHVVLNKAEQLQVCCVYIVDSKLSVTRFINNVLHISL